jgi:hypothetical protein
MKAKVLLGLLMAGFSAGAALAATGSGPGPSSSWNQMQKFEYYLGDMAGALNVCRMYGLHSEILELASLSPYGKRGYQGWAVYDDIRGAVCGRVKNDAEKVLKDKVRLLEYLKSKYDCTSDGCVER